MSAYVAGKHTTIVYIEDEDIYGPIYNVLFVPANVMLIKEYIEAVQEIEEERAKRKNESGAW